MPAPPAPSAPSAPNVRQDASGQKLALVGLIINVVLAIVKLVAGMLGHSYALVADALESLTDVVGSAIVWSGLRIAARPPDEAHPYGHGKAEALAAMIVSMLLAAAGLGIGIAAIHHVIEPKSAPAIFTLWVLLIVIAIKETLFRAGLRIADQSGSGAVLADAWHHRSDAITSVAAAIGISAALIGGPGWERADGIAALFASGVILYNAGRILQRPMRELMDTKPAGIVQRVRRIAQSIPDVKGIEKVLARKSGTRYLVDMHMEVDPAMTVQDAHALAHRVKDTVMSDMPNVQDVLIHIEPFRERAQDSQDSTD